MAAGNNPNVEGFVGVVRLAWCVHLMLINDAVSASSSNNSGYVNSCLEFIFSHNVFQFLLDNILRTAAYQVCYVQCFPSLAKFLFSYLLIKAALRSMHLLFFNIAFAQPVGLQNTFKTKIVIWFHSMTLSAVCTVLLSTIILRESQIYFLGFPHSKHGIQKMHGSGFWKLLIYSGCF